MRNFCNIFFINFSNISGNYFLTLSDQTGRFPLFAKEKTPQYFIPGSSTLHQRVLLPFFFSSFSSFSSFSLSFSIFCSVSFIFLHHHLLPHRHPSKITLVPRKRKCGSSNDDYSISSNCPLSLVKRYA